MDQDVSKIVELIDRKIKALTVTRQTLIDEFGNGGKAKPGLTMAKEALSRKDTVEQLLLQHGPMTRKEIMECAPDIPEGSISFVLSDKKRFVPKDGKWDVVKKERESNGSDLVFD
jgi:hypothetical protein